jgi:hypothetical protein
MTFLELAERILKETKKPLSVSEIWAHATKIKLTSELGSQGKTPAATLGAQLHVSARDNENSPFATVGSRPMKFYLKKLKYSKEDLAEDLEIEEDLTHTMGYSERDLHAVLSYFIFFHLNAFSKTLDHKKSTKKEFGEWVHPDVVACYFPIEEWKPEVYDFSMALKDTPIHLMSFEIKRQLNFSNLRESFFQAVSNSSWAHEGYLVTSVISEEKEFTDELKRLSNSFGIGVISLDIEDPDNCEVLIPARDQEYLDWETINKLAINPDFKEFLKRVKKDIESKEIRKEWYDKVESRESLIKFFKDKRGRISSK